MAQTSAGPPAAPPLPPVRLARQETTTSTFSLKATRDRDSWLITSPNRTSGGGWWVGGWLRERWGGAGGVGGWWPKPFASHSSWWPQHSQPTSCSCAATSSSQPVTAALSFLHAATHPTATSLPAPLPTRARQLLLHILGALLAADAGALARKRDHVVAALHQLLDHKLANVAGSTHHQHPHVGGRARAVVRRRSRRRRSGGKQLPR